MHSSAPAWIPTGMHNRHMTELANILAEIDILTLTAGRAGEHVRAYHEAHRPEVMPITYLYPSVLHLENKKRELLGSPLLEPSESAG